MITDRAVGVGTARCGQRQAVLLVAVGDARAFVVAGAVVGRVVAAGRRGRRRLGGRRFDVLHVALAALDDDVALAVVGVGRRVHHQQLRLAGHRFDARHQLQNPMP